MLKTIINELQTAKRIIVLDLEATCANDGSISQRQMEIIEFGAVVLKESAKTIIKEFNEFVRPVLNPILTPFCTQLTSITQDQVSEAEEFPIVFGRFIRECWDESSVLASWGDFDYRILTRDFKRHQNTLTKMGYHSFPIPINHHYNIRSLTKKVLNIKKPEIEPILSYFGMEFEGRPHRGINDSKNIAKILSIVLNKAKRFS